MGTKLYLMVLMLVCTSYAITLQEIQNMKKDLDHGECQSNIIVRFFILFYISIFIIAFFHFRHLEFFNSKFLKL